MSSDAEKLRMHSYAPDVKATVSFGSSAAGASVFDGVSQTWHMPLFLISAAVKVNVFFSDPQSQHWHFLPPSNRLHLNKTTPLAVEEGSRKTG
jgi:hypothetical protein